ncbi:conserved hypothetical protein [Leishmania mexicana MHOM/GT/2001/U1103]|uniref:Leucine-rich repeat protein n=1 Tax=Leishmania mexicana (strain MHOM/GT/2001/U1103) TaxID=929439 RepID=E9ALL0_LEIMU|nr:conserved hypothetical protein [Leishmania mexicana MHOM/GT/2001/U1103]CBZ23815.1 conserved hypothetical protein [Leishmania mexicana MHOM/GT/2001/U1103]
MAAVMTARGPAPRHRRHSGYTSALCYAIVAALFCALCCEVRALEVGEFFPGQIHMSAKDRYKSVQALQSLQRAINDPELQKEVESALRDTARGFDMCQSALYRCNRVTGALEEAVIKNMQGGTVKWDEYPTWVKRIRITDSRLEQPLVLSSLPANLEEFVATNVEWESHSILRVPQSGVGGVVTEPLTHLRVLQCDNCALVKAEVTTTSQLESLQVLSLSGNPDLMIDLRELPRNLQSLQLSYTKLAHSTVKEVLETAPAFLSLLNISFTDVALTLDMLSSARKQLTMLDVSGLESGNPESPLAVSQLQSACSESDFSLAGLYLTRCSLTGTLPDLSNCTKLKVMDVSHNLLEGAVFAQLPKNIEVLRLNSNAIQGGLRISELPRTLQFLDISENQFTGEVDLSALPPQLQYFNIGHNHFSGKVNLTQLPETVKFVYMEYNHFTGEADLVDLPLGLRFIMVHHNNWDYLLPAP